MITTMELVVEVEHDPEIKQEDIYRAAIEELEGMTILQIFKGKGKSNKTFSAVIDNIYKVVPTVGSGE